MQKIRPFRKFFAAGAFGAALILLFLLPVCLNAQPVKTVPRIPTFDECKKLSSKKTPPEEKTQLAQTLKMQGMYCAMQTNPFPVIHVFMAGQGKAQLRLAINSENHYAIDRKSLLDVLLPDRGLVSPMHMMMFAGQLLGLLGNIINANIDPMQVHHVGSKVGSLAAGAGANARVALQQLEALRIAARVNETDIEIPDWLLKLATIKGETNSTPQQLNVQNMGLSNMAQNGPQWMQKATGALQKLMGSFAGGE